MDFDDFSKRFLAALYIETEQTGREYHKAATLLEKYGLNPKPLWIARIVDDWENWYFRDVGKVLGGYELWSFRISGEGSRRVEEDFRDEAEILEFLNQKFSYSPDLSPASAPAAGRIVPLNHNSSAYRDISTKLEELYSEARSNNQIGESTDERNRIVESLDAARKFWAMQEIKLVQVQIGIVMAIEDAGRALEKIGKATGWSLLTDLVKKFVKDMIGIEF